jgi:cytoskeletal protein CcmA (bactofilin family)
MSALFGRRLNGGEVAHEPTETVISGGTAIVGPVRSSDGIRVDGRVDGPVHSEAAVIVGADGIVHGDITALSAHIAGAVHGQVRVEYRLEIAATGELFGDVEVARLAIQDGAIFRGQVLMREPNGNDDNEPSDD